MVPENNFLSKPSVRVWLIFLAWTLNGLLFSSQMFAGFDEKGHPISWTQALLWGMSYCYLWAILTPLIIRFGRHCSIEGKRWLVNVLIHLAVSLVVSYTVRVFSEYVRIQYVFNETPDLRKILAFSYLNFDYGLLMYWFILLIDHTLSSYKKNRENELKASQLEAQLAQAQLQALKMQLHPHFLFNTMNAISVLIKKNPDTAQKMLMRLSDLLRISLEHVGIQEVSLAQELEFLDHYIKIQQTRFGDRLSVTMEVDPTTLKARVPNLILQPIVENAIEHGVAKRAGAGVVTISAQRFNSSLRLQVRDNGRGLKKNNHENVKEGVGLSNTRARLQQLYGSAHNFQLCNADGGGFLATLEIPYQDTTKSTAKD